MVEASSQHLILNSTCRPALSPTNRSALQAKACQAMFLRRALKVEGGVGVLTSLRRGSPPFTSPPLSSVSVGPPFYHWIRCFVHFDKTDSFSGSLRNPVRFLRRKL